MLIIPGPAALSDFRSNKLFDTLSQKLPQLASLSVQFVHFAVSSEELNATETQILHRLLTYGEEAPHPVDKAMSITVVPRLGTRSPWSSKAGDIAHNCGLQKINRLERGRIYHLVFEQGIAPEAEAIAEVHSLLHDRMTESLLPEEFDLEQLFSQEMPASLEYIDMKSNGLAALKQANARLGLALSNAELDYLLASYKMLERNSTDVELMMFAQANSEHCRHKIFNADWVIDGKGQPRSLFDMIRHTHEMNPQGVLSAYHDNASVIRGGPGKRLLPDAQTGRYAHLQEDVHILMKVETHNHPTAISPFPGAATGSGGEIRDEGAVGRGSKPKAGLVGFSVSDLCIPDLPQPWENDPGRPGRMASPLDIMIEGPIGAAAFNNEFGRPNLAGYFRTYLQSVGDDNHWRGYHKPIMVAGGLGSIRKSQINKVPLFEGAVIVVLGGPAMLIGLGGSAASSVSSGSSGEALDFASVQRDNPEMERRCQEVIDRCWILGEASPILSIHDVGAGGLSNAIPEILKDGGVGGCVELRKIPNDEPGMSPMQIWCNESQERYVLAINPELLDQFEEICQRERCVYAVLGAATDEKQMKVSDELLEETPVDMPMDVLLGRMPRMVRIAERVTPQEEKLDLKELDIVDAVKRVLQFPAVADKSFLITIGDRTVSGLVARDQMVGPWQVPVSDVAVTAVDFESYRGEAMSMGERTPLAVINPAASGRMAIGEAITNIAAANIGAISNIKLSANWMAAAGHPGEDAALYQTVHAVGMELCPALGIAIPVGKDSLSMKTLWQTNESQKSVVSPLSLIVSAFAPAERIDRTLTPELRSDVGDTRLLLIDLGHCKSRMGGSVLAQVFNLAGGISPDLDNPEDLKALFGVIQLLNAEVELLAYHDRSDGGLFTTLCEMAFAGGMGLDIDLAAMPGSSLQELFNEELGVVIQVSVCRHSIVMAAIKKAGLGDCAFDIGEPVAGKIITFRRGDKIIYSQNRFALRQLWSETSYRMQALRDNALDSKQAFDALDDAGDPGLHAHLTFNLDDDIAAPMLNSGAKPKVAILREQGVNGQIEMAGAFFRAGFDTFDVHMSDIIAGRVSLADFQGLAACGGFSYGDVLGAGEGWAKSILYNSRARDDFSAFFTRGDSFALGACNGCQMLSNLHDIIPDTESWPRFVRNRSEQYEARLSMVEILESPSLFLSGMAGSRMPIAVAHGEGRADYAEGQGANKALSVQTAVMRFVDNRGDATENYPANPNGSPLGLTGFTTPDGRVTIMMPHPERVFRAVQMSWRDRDWNEDSPWMRLFRNARVNYG